MEKGEESLTLDQPEPNSQEPSLSEVAYSPEYKYSDISETESDYYKAREAEFNQRNSRGSSSFKSPEPVPPPRRSKPPAPQSPSKEPEELRRKSEENVDKPTSKETNLKAKSLSFKETEKRQEEKGAETEEEENSENDKDGNREPDDVVLRPKTRNDEEASKFQHRASFMMKTKGKIFYKKKGPFSTWKLHFAIVDDFKLQMNFFKSPEEYEKLARCKLSIDLRFVTNIKPQKPRILQSNFPFKMQRRAGLSTVKLAAFNEEERAKWITTIEGITEKVKMTTTLDSIWEEKRSSTLPNLTNQSRRMSSDSETHTTSSAPDQEELIRPKKVSSAGFKLDSQQISSVKLKRISSDKDESKSINDDEIVAQDNFDPKEKFGVQLRRVHTEKSPPRFEREQSPEYQEFKQKYNSLSLSRKNKAPKLPLNENSVCSHLVENISREEIIITGVVQPTRETKETKETKNLKETKETKDPNRKRSPSPNIPVSKAVEAVIKNKTTNDEPEILQENSKPKLNVCHATSTVISYFESSDLNAEDITLSNKVEKSAQPDIVSSTSGQQNEEISVDSVTTTKPDIVESSPVIPKIKLTQAGEKVEIRREKSKTELITDKLDDMKKLANIIDSGSTIDEGFPQDYVKLIIEEDITSKDVSTQSPSKDLIEEGTDDRNNDMIANDDQSKIEIATINVNADVKDDKDMQPSATDMQPSATDMQPSATMPNEEGSFTNLDYLDKKLEETKSESVSSDPTDGVCKAEADISNVSSIQTAKEITSTNQIDSIVLGEEKVTDSSVSDQDNEMIIVSKSEENRSSILSYQSQFSTESDEPLPKFNFLGRSDRSSSGSASAKESLIEDESKMKFSDSDESVDQSGVLREKPLKSRNFLGTDNLTDKETRSSLVMPEFTVVEENAEELLLDDIKTGDNLKKVSPENEFHESVSDGKDTKLEPEDKEIETKIIIKRETDNESDYKDENLSKENFNLEIDVKTEDDNNLIKETTKNSEDKLKDTPNISEESLDDTLKTVEDDLEKTLKSIEDDLELVKSVSVLRFQHIEEQIVSSDSSKSRKVKEYENILDDQNLKEESKEGNKYEEMTVTQNFDFEEIVPITEEDIEINRPSDSSSNDLEIDYRPAVNTTSQEKGEMIKEIEYEETEDYFPGYGMSGYRLRNKGLIELQENALRNSGIQGLKEFLKENEIEDLQQECKSGISRLGHSPAIEKLRKEVP